MKNVLQETKNWVVECVHKYPDVSYTQIAKMFGVDRKSVSIWVKGGISEERKDYLRGWQKQKSEKAKFILIQFLGGCCQQCGYHECYDALDFHHRNPSEKDKQVSDILLGNFDVALEEAKKCDLICCRCHREQHANEGSLGPNNLSTGFQPVVMGVGNSGEHPHKVLTT